MTKQAKQRLRPPVLIPPVLVYLAAAPNKDLDNSDEWASRQIKAVVQHARALRIATEQVTYLAHGVEIVQY